LKEKKLSFYVHRFYSASYSELQVKYKWKRVWFRPRASKWKTIHTGIGLH